MAWETLAIVWFLLLGVLLCGYAILDGFDLGVGILHPFVPRNEQERRVAISSIGPLWDGNEVWLVTFGGALFAAFPIAYASVFSGFYTAFMLLLFALIFRAVSLEFRGKVHHEGWRRVWDWGFFSGSALATLLFGVATGNAMRGIALDRRGVFIGSILDQLNPYALMVGLFAVAMMAMHGSIFLYLKAAGDFQARIRTWMWRTFGLFLVMYLFTTIYTLVQIPRATANFSRWPILAMLVIIANVLAIANIPRSIFWDRPLRAFVSSSVAIAGFLALFGMALFPNLLAAQQDPALSVTIFNAASSAKTLTIMLIIAGIGMPFVLTYTAIIYWTFRGKVREESGGY